MCSILLPVEGHGVSLGLAAENHLSAILAGSKGKHHTARLFGEDGAQLDSTSCVGGERRGEQC